jgi:hypothetical protein
MPLLDVWEAIPTWETDLEAARHYAFHTSGFTGEELAREFVQTMRLPNSRALYDVLIANHVPRRLTRLKALLWRAPFAYRQVGLVRFTIRLLDLRCTKVAFAVTRRCVGQRSHISGSRNRAHRWTTAEGGM